MRSGRWQEADGQDSEKVTGVKGPRNGRGADATEVTKGVANMSMGSKATDAMASGKEKAKVSVLNSFVDSSGSSENLPSGNGGGLSMHERLALASQVRRMSTFQKGGTSAQQVEAMDIDRQKRSKMELEVQAAAMQHQDVQMDRLVVDGKAGGVPEAAPGASPAKRQRKSALGQVKLTGAHVEPRQEQ